MSSIISSYLILSSAFLVAFSNYCKNPNDDFAIAQLLVTVSPVSSIKLKNEFRIYWNHPNFISGDTVAFYKGNPEINNNLAAIYTHTLADPTGQVNTGISAPSDASAYHAALLRDGKIKKVTNLSRKPNWMEERKSLLENFTIPQLFIPGTHGSGFYARSSDNIFGLKLYTLKWTQTQDHNIIDQLERGIRYLDIRPAYDAKKNKYNVNHATIVMIPMEDVINEINVFLSKTNEIVILSFKEFPVGFSNDEDHKKFSLYIEEAFETHLQPYSSSKGWNTPLDYFWKTNKRLIITYDYWSYRSPKFWPRLTQWWGDCRSIECLYSFIKSNYDRSARYSQQYSPHAAMVELTHDKSTGIDDILSLTKKSKLRQWADEAGSLIPRWYNDEWYAKANVVAPDFFIASGVVDLAIYWNERRANNCVP